MSEPKPPVLSAIPAPDRPPRLARVAPSPSLASLVACYWTLSVGADEVPARVHALPDACIDLVFDVSGAEARAYLAGARATAATYTHERPTELVAASFLPAGASTLIGVAADLVPGDRWTPLESLVGDVGRALAAQIGALPAAERLGALDAFLSARLRRGATDARVARAVAEVTAAGGAVDIARLGRAVGASPRNLGRLFHAWVGVSPKRFARIMRAQRALARLADGSADGELAALAVELGYSDQAHLGRELRELFGAAPGALAETFKRLSDPFNR